MLSLRDRRLPNARLRWLLMAMREELGEHGVRMILHQANLKRYLEQLPPADRFTGSSPSELTRLLNSVRSYYGVGARSTLLRIGDLAFQEQLSHQLSLNSLRKLMLYPLTFRQKRRWMLKRLVAEMSYPDKCVELKEIGNDVIQIYDYSADRTWQTQATEPICAYTVGRISAALFWATGEHIQVSETTCCATGAPACCFNITS